MEVQGFIANQLDSNAARIYTPDYLGSVQLLEKSGFSPFTRSSPLESTLFQVFNRFVEKTGLNADSNQLKDEYLTENPSVQRAVDLYSALDNSFAARGAGEKAAIVDFLNSKIDDYITEKDANENKTLSRDESGFSQTLFRAIDANRDAEIDTEEIQDNFYNDFSQLNNVLNYFQSTPGVLVDMYA